MLIEDFILNGEYRPDLIIMTTDSYAFQPLLSVHWLTTANPDIARYLIQEYDLTTPIGTSRETNLVQNILEHNFIDDSTDITSWITNQIAGLNLIWSPTLDDDPWKSSVNPRNVRGGSIAWANARPGVLNAFVDLAKSHHIPLLLVSSPQNYSAPDYSTWLSTQSREQNIPLLDCSDLLPPTEFLDTSLHMTAEGNQRLTAQIIPWLQTWWADPKLNNSIVTYCPSYSGVN